MPEHAALLITQTSISPIRSIVCFGWNLYLPLGFEIEKLHAKYYADRITVIFC